MRARASPRYINEGLREILLPLHLLRWDLGPLSLQYSTFSVWQRCLAASGPRGWSLLTGGQQGEKKHSGRWCLPVWLINLPGLAGLWSTWGSDKATHYLPPGHQYMFRPMSRTDEEGLHQNILGCPHLQIHLKTPGVQDNTDRSNGRILPAEGIFFTWRTTCLYQETLLQKRLDLRADRRSFWFPILLNTDGRISAGVSGCVIQHIRVWGHLYGCEESAALF